MTKEKPLSEVRKAIKRCDKYIKNANKMTEEKPILNTTNNELISNKEKPLSEKAINYGNEDYYAQKWAIPVKDVKEAVERLTPELFHEVYEEVAIRVGWETQRKCRVKFDDLPEKNQETMITTIRLIKERIFGKKLI